LKALDFWRGFDLVRRLAAGAMTEVLLVRHRERGQTVAVKRVARGCVGEPLVESMFEAEAMLAVRLSHPNVVSALDLCRDRDGTVCLVMEYMDGPTLAELLRTGPLPVGAAVQVAREMLTGLGHVHEVRIPGRPRGIAHCGIAPENVLLSRQGAVKIARSIMTGPWR
jgi:serine/threonine-protein kinase